MAKISITIEAINPVNKSNIDVIINTVSEMEGVSSANLKFDDHYKFIFNFEYDSSLDYMELVKRIKLLLSRYSSGTLTIKNNQEPDYQP